MNTFLLILILLILLSGGNNNRKKIWVIMWEQDIAHGLTQNKEIFLNDEDFYDFKKDLEKNRNVSNIEIFEGYMDKNK